MTGRYQIANTGIQITSVYETVHRFCRDYAAPDAPVALSIETTVDDIEFERRRSEVSDTYAQVPFRRSSDGFLESLAVSRKIAEAVPFRDTFLMHGSCVAVDGEAYLFTAKSGTGKSTHTRLWRELFGDRAIMVNDDKPLIRVSDGVATAFGTPWNGKHHLGSNVAVPLKAICILERAEQNRIREISAAEAYPMLLQQIYRPLDVEAMKRTLMLIDRLFTSVRFFRLGCNMDPEAARVSYEAMKG